MSLTLAALAAACPGATLTGAGDTVIAGLSIDSRSVAPGGLFAALPGQREDGRAYVAAALARGAAAILHDGSRPLAAPVQLIHPRPRWAWARLAAAWHGHPADRLRLVGITGTNGKTTVAAMIEAILTAAGERVGVVGTTGVRFAGERHANPLTTPDAYALHGWLARMAAAGCGVAVMEVSSHALDQERVAGLDFAAAVFTNFTRDHLDYHRNEADYFAAKARLFREYPLGAAILNLDDGRGRQLAGLARAERVIGYGVASADAVWRAERVTMDWQGLCATLVSPLGRLAVTLPQSGRFNLDNALAATATAVALGASDGAVRTGLAAMTPAPGRMQTLWQGQPFAVVVDFAHTPDALERLLQAARELTGGRLWVVFGCGGDRDPGKRPMMGAVAGRLADEVVVTDDNPRTESPAAIRAAIMAGRTANGANWREEGERRLAIALALGRAQPGDAVLIAGKGHETVQIGAGGSQPFDDAAVAHETLAALGYRG